MSKATKHLLIGSTEAYSGKSATILGVARQCQERGLTIAYGKPIGTCPSESEADGLDEDVRLFGNTLNLPANALLPPLLFLNPTTIRKRLQGSDREDYSAQLSQIYATAQNDLVVLEGPGDLEEGSLFNLSLNQMAQVLDASVLLVSRFHATATVDTILTAKQRLGSRLSGVLINDIPEDQMEDAQQYLRTFLEEREIPVLGLLPRSALLRSVSVRELVHQLNAEVLCRADRLDLMVESLTIGAMSVSSALKYFQKTENKAVITGGDRTDIQLAALETSTQCLILTGHLTPSPAILSRAEDLEVPILSVDLDTLTTVEIVDRAFGQVRLYEPIKVQYVQQMMAEYFDGDRLMTQLGLEPVAASN
ncbi:MAG: phosphotransacetylase family protein [Leptolyngbyaceae cyanobacterium bins.59]|nr:phosphotransacetylase family protein [Leptolyngbyaceae cyanobacterium bins.59]